MDTLDCIKTRRSIRKYKDTPIADEIINDILDCARRAPSSCDTQPWDFIVVKEQKKRKGGYNKYYYKF